MQPRARKYFWDMLECCKQIERFSADKAFEQYEEDPLLRAAVERMFITLGEALTRLRRLDPAEAESILQSRRIIAFRNLLIHEYTEVRAADVWQTVREHVPELKRQLEERLAGS
jgi:uncharacterized protein with HEPN domain